jgi:hypothetical protein
LFVCSFAQKSVQLVELLSWLAAMSGGWSELEPDLLCASQASDDMGDVADAIRSDTDDDAVLVAECWWATKIKQHSAHIAPAPLPAGTTARIVSGCSGLLSEAAVFEAWALAAFWSS